MNKEAKNLSKRERFEKLATYRTNNILHALKVLGNCANKSAYEYEEKDVKKIFKTIERRVIETKSKFKINKKDNEEFKL